MSRTEVSKRDPEGKIIHLIRHGEAWHNYPACERLDRPPTANDQSLTTAPLDTSQDAKSATGARLPTYGQVQCVDLCERFPFHNSVDLIVTSPLVRTIETTIIALKPVIKPGNVPIIAEPLFVENGSGSPKSCDFGHSKAWLEDKFSDDAIDFEPLDDGVWPEKTGKYAWIEGNPSVVKQRAKEARQWLLDRPEKEIVVVTHGNFLHFLTKDFHGLAPEQMVDTSWENTEFRSYILTDETELVERQDSKDRSRFKIQR